MTKPTSQTHADASAITGSSKAQPAHTPGSISPDRFVGYPIVSFQVWERRSLTVHIEDFGMFDVFAESGISSGARAVAGRYLRFDEAQFVADKLNALWRLAPQSTGNDIVAFINRSSVEAEMLAALKIARGNVSSLLASKHPAVFGEWLNALDEVIAKAEAAR